MFRVTKAEQQSRTLITVDGQLSGEGIEVLEVCCDQEISKGCSVDLLLRDLTDIDQKGRELLRRLAGKGVHVEAKGVYTSYVVRQLTPDERTDA